MFREEGDNVLSLNVDGKLMQHAARDAGVGYSYRFGSRNVHVDWGPERGNWPED